MNPNYIEARERIKEITMRMNNLTEEEFYQKYNHDINFNSGFKLLVQVFIQANL